MLCKVIMWFNVSISRKLTGRSKACALRKGLHGYTKGATEHGLGVPSYQGEV